MKLYIMVCNFEKYLKANQIAFNGIKKMAKEQGFDVEVAYISQKRYTSEQEIQSVKADYSYVNYYLYDNNWNLEFNILIFSGSHYTVIDNIETDERAERTGFGSKLILYYADRGENLWDIAKKYHTSVEIIKRDNTLDNSIVTESKMLLISGN